MKPALAILLLAAIGLSACSAFPEQGFATRAMGGPPGSELLRDTLAPASNFRGEARVAPQQAAARPAAPAVHSDICTRTAQQREDDASGQGFDQSVQQHVYDQTLSDCEAWSSLHTLH